MTAAPDATTRAILAELVQAYDHWRRTSAAHSHARQRAEFIGGDDALRELTAAGSAAAAAGRRFHAAFAAARRFCAAAEANPDPPRYAADCASAAEIQS